ncbi:hypothetical protein JCM5350_007914 [Sporobolomyces pararoseus]
MTSSWQPQVFESPLSSSFASLPYPYPSGSPSSSSLGVPPQQPTGGIRRTRSSGALEIDTMRRPSFQSPWSVNPPFSPTTSLAPPRDDAYPLFDYYRRPSSTTAYPLPDYPSPSNSSLDNPRRFHRRTSSAQPAFFLSESNSSSPGPFTPVNSLASGLSPQSSRRTSMNYSFSTPASHRMQCQPSAEDVDKFLKDMNEMLGPDAMAPVKSSPTTATPPRSNGLTLTTTSSPPSSSPRAGGRPQQTYVVSGVVLTEDEYRQYAHSEQTLNRPQQYFPSTSQQQYAPQPSPGYDLQRPRSAPPSPQVDPSGAFAPFYSPPSPPPPAPLRVQPTTYLHDVSPFKNSSSSSIGYVHPRPFHRRGSSVDATIPRTFVTTPSIPVEYGYASYPTTTTNHLTPSPTRSNLPVGYPPPHLPPPPQYYNTPPYSSTPVSRMFSSSSSTTTNTTFNEEAPVSPVSPTRPKGFGTLEAVGGGGRSCGVEGKYRYRTASSNDTSPTKARGGGKGGVTKGPISFINFSASDSKALLSGVAPSGSSKKRGRDETTAKGNEEGKKARK